jgi:hypothetical protein
MAITIEEIGAPDENNNENEDSGIGEMEVASVQDELSEDSADDNLEPDAEPTEEAENDDGEERIIIGEDSESEEEETKAAPQWVKDLRKRDRENQRRIRDLEKQLQTAKPAEPVADYSRPPQLSDPDINYDEDLYRDKMLKHAEALSRKQFLDMQAQQEHAKIYQRYNESKAKLRVSDFSDAEDAVVNKLTMEQQDIILQAADDTARLVYGLGKNAKILDQLAAISNPIRFAAEIAKLETQMKTVKKASKPAPEKAVVGRGAPAASGNELERLRAEAEKTGDYSKVLAYKDKMRRQG